MKRKKIIWIREGKQLISYFVITLNRMAMKRRANMCCTCCYRQIVVFSNYPKLCHSALLFHSAHCFERNHVNQHSNPKTRKIEFAGFHAAYVFLTIITTLLLMSAYVAKGHFALVGRIDVLMRCARDNIMSDA